MQQDMARNFALDGLRGWAALSVVVFHFVIEVFGHKFSGLSTWLIFLDNGNIAVTLFFVLSGYVLTRGRWRRSNSGLMRTLATRYLRLTLPIVAISLVAAVVMMTGIADTAPAADIVGRGGWLGGFARFPASLPGALRYACFEVYRGAQNGDYNPFLWTMVVELWGSVVVIVLSHFRLPRAMPYLLLVGLLAAALFSWPRGGGMIVGALIALVEVDHGAPPEPAASRLHPGLGLAAFMAALAAAWVVWRAGWAYSFNLPLAAVMLLTTLHCAPLRRFFGTPLSLRLGQLSFPLYLVQFVVLISLTSRLIVAVDALGWLNLPGAFVIAALSLAATLWLAQAFLPVEILTMEIVRRLRGRAGQARPPFAAPVPDTAR